MLTYIFTIKKIINISFFLISFQLELNNNNLDQFNVEHSILHVQYYWSISFVIINFKSITFYNFPINYKVHDNYKVTFLSKFIYSIFYNI